MAEKPAKKTLKNKKMTVLDVIKNSKIASNSPKKDQLNP